MKYNKMLYAVSAFSLMTSMVYAEQTGPGPGLSVEVSADVTFTNPSGPLSEAQFSFLKAYIKNPAAFRSFSPERIRDINVAIRLHEAELPSADLASFRMSQLIDSGMTRSEVADFQKVITLLRQGSTLNKAQNQILKNFISRHMVGHPELCLHDFFPVLAGDVKNNPDVFNAGEWGVLKNTALISVGLSAQEAANLDKMADLGSSNIESLGDADVLVLNKLVLLGQCNLVCVWDPSKLLTLQGIMLDHATLFKPLDLDAFNRAVSQDRGVQFFRQTNGNFNARRRVNENQNAIILQNKQQNSGRPGNQSPSVRPSVQPVPNRANH